ncbi:MAG: site-specific integrase, partial [Deltaproteobacteria bacterium]|nr:site-specific integrase [Deltaproteobacteria bacterium]
MNLIDCIHCYFHNYLPQIKGASEQTIDSYRHAFSLFFKFAAAHKKVAVKKLRIDHITSDLIFAFLNHLEQNRKNTARTRNNRLAAIKSFAKMLRLLYPEHNQIAERILNIPQKRCQKRLIGFLTHDEALKVLDSVDLKRK